MSCLDGCTGFEARWLLQLLVIGMTLQVVGVCHLRHLNLRLFVIICLFAEIGRLEAILILSFEPSLLTRSDHLTAFIINVRLRLLVMPFFGVEELVDFRVTMSPTENAVVTAFNSGFYLSFIFVDILLWYSVTFSISGYVRVTLVTHASSWIRLQGILLWLVIMIVIPSVVNIVPHRVAILSQVFCTGNIHFTKLIQWHISTFLSISILCLKIHPFKNYTIFLSHSYCWLFTRISWIDASVRLNFRKFNLFVVNLSSSLPVILRTEPHLYDWVLVLNVCCTRLLGTLLTFLD